MGHYEGGVRKILLFLKKKKQKDFYFWRCGKIPAMASIVGAAEKVKVFWFFSSEKNTLTKNISYIRRSSGRKSYD
jgi:hypothetical protein